MRQVLTILLLCISMASFAQLPDDYVPKPTIWTIEYTQLSSTEIELTVTINLNPGWMMLSESIAENTAVPFSISFKNKALRPLKLSANKVPEPSNLSGLFEAPMSAYSGQVIFKQKIQMNEGTNYIEGEIEYMLYLDKAIFPPVSHCFILRLSANKNIIFVRKNGCRIIKN